MADGTGTWNYLIVGGEPAKRAIATGRGPSIEPRGDWNPRGGRGGLFILVLLGHLLVFLLVIHAGPPGEGKPFPALRLITLSASSAPAPAPPAPAETEKAAEPEAPPEPQPAAAAESAFVAPQLQQLAGGAPAGGGCALAAEIGAAIQNDVDAMSALAMLPPDLRSTADAVMLWNGQWVATERPETRPSVLLLQQVIERSVMAATAECRFALNAGPQFIPVSDRDRTTMIVVGSGDWHWDSLIVPVAPEGLPSEASAAASELVPKRATRRSTPWWVW